MALLEYLIESCIVGELCARFWFRFIKIEDQLPLTLVRYELPCSRIDHMRTSCAYFVVAVVPAAVDLAAVGIVAGIAVGTAVEPCSGNCSTCRHYCTSSCRSPSNCCRQQSHRLTSVPYVAAAGPCRTWQTWQTRAADRAQRHSCHHRQCRP